MPRPAASTFCVVAGGGTAGHTLPGIAVADVLVERGHPHASIHFVASERANDAELIEAAGFTATLLPGRGIQRRITWENLGAVWGLLRAAASGFRLVGRLRPEVVLAVGGFAAAACGLAAAARRVPIVVAEQNARAGAVNKMLARFATSVAVPFEVTDLPDAVVTGNPVRKAVLAVDPVEGRARARVDLGLAPDALVVLVFAGSLGSRRINEAVVDLMRRWEGRRDLAVRHVVGSRDWDDLGPRLSGLDDKALTYQAVVYEDDMARAMAAADVAVCRAGGTTVAELALLALPAILVPLPIATRDHQTANARELVEAGAAVLIPDAELDGDRLEAELGAIIDIAGRLEAMRDAASELGHPGAAERIGDLVERAAR